jgi:hypothetical protein
VKLGVLGEVEAKERVCHFFPGAWSVNFRVSNGFGMPHVVVLR